MGDALDIHHNHPGIYVRCKVIEKVDLGDIGLIAYGYDS